VKKEPERVLREGAEALGFPLAEGLIEQFMTYLSELLRWNRAYNLTALVDPREIVVKHFLDSLLFLKAFPESGDLRLFDLGSGAGFPGLPLKLYRPGMSCRLVEPSRKKCAFLRNVIRRLDLSDVEVRQDRADRIRDLGEATVVVSRALFKLREIQEQFRGILLPGTRVILSKGPAVEQELAQSILPVEVQRHRLPFLDVDRWLIIWIT